MGRNQGDSYSDSVNLMKKFASLLIGTLACISLLGASSPKQVVNVRTIEYYTSAIMDSATVQSNTQSTWQIAPNLTDIGGGI